MSDESPKTAWSREVQAIVDSAMDAVIGIDDQGVVVGWNAKAEWVFGWTAGEAIGTELSDLMMPERFVDAHLTGLSTFRKTGEAPIVDQRLEVEARRKDGTEIPVELSVTRVELDGKTQFVAYVRDISDWHDDDKLKDRAVLEARMVGETAFAVARANSFEDSLQRVLQSLCERIAWPVGHAWLPSDSGKVLVSSGIWQIAPGHAADELQRVTGETNFPIGRGLPGQIWQTKAPRWFERIRDGFDPARAAAAEQHGLACAFGFPVTSYGRVVAILEFFHPTPQAEDADLLNIVARIGNQLGELVRLRHADHQQARLAAIVDSSTDAIIGRDLNGMITSWNSGAEQVYGYDESEVLGKPITIVLPEGQSAEEVAIVEAVRRGERLDHFVTSRRQKDGRLIPVSLTISPTLDRDGNVVGVSSIERDISARVQREEELKDARQTAMEASRARGEFLANVSHELRTPMNAIIGMTEIALDEDLPKEVRDYISTANDAAHSLLNLLNDVLDFSKLEAGKFTLSEEPFGVAELIQETAKTLSSKSFEKGIELICDLPSHMPPRVIGDANRIRQIVTNLVSNAIKFTEQGEVVISVAPVRRLDDRIQLRFVVSDTGIGIPIEEQERIVQPFVQMDSSATREQGGTGLGLAICTDLLRLMGSRLVLRSTPGEGSEFSFRIWFDIDKEKQETVHFPREALRGVAILVVDDNETSRRTVANMLGDWGLQATCAEGAEEARERVQEARYHGTPFALAIVDALMPKIDGYELAHQLTHSSDSELPIVLMVSSTDRHEFREREDDRYVAEYLSKPVSQSELLAVLLSVLGIEGREGAGETPANQESNAETGQDLEKTSSIRILVAEDTPANQKVVRTILERKGYSVSVANNGREAVDLHKKRPFDLILMDIQMPTMDGFQATSAIRQLEADGEPTPIVAMTAHAMKGDREKCIQAGMDSYIPKPLDRSLLLRLVQDFTRAADLQPAGSRGSKSESARSEAHRNEGFGGSNVEVLNVCAAMKRLGEDEELYREMVGFFDEDLPALLQSVTEAGATHDFTRLRQAAHRLKGLAAGLGGERAAACAAHLEQMAEQQDAEGLSGVGELQQTFRELSEALGPFRNGPRQH